MIHLESGQCASNVSCEDIHEWAFQCYQHKEYTVDDDGDLCYWCKACKKDFEYVSGLFQHIETPTCGARNNGYFAKLKKYIVNQVEHSSLRTDNVDQRSMLLYESFNTLTLSKAKDVPFPEVAVDTFQLAHACRALT